MSNTSQAQVKATLKNYMIGLVKLPRIPNLASSPCHLDASLICNWLPLPDFEFSLVVSPWVWLD